MKKTAHAKRVDHVCVTVSDMERSLKFYCGLLGMVQKGNMEIGGPVLARLTGKDRVRMKLVFLVCPDNPEAVIELTEYLESRGKQADNKLGDVGSSHICFEVADIHTTYSELKAAGAQFVSEPVEFTLEDSRKVGCVYLIDPDGYMLELVTFFKSR